MWGNLISFKTFHGLFSNFAITNKLPNDISRFRSRIFLKSDTRPAYFSFRFIYISILTATLFVADNPFKRRTFFIKGFLVAGVAGNGCLDVFSIDSENDPVYE